MRFAITNSEIAALASTVGLLLESSFQGLSDAESLHATAKYCKALRRTGFNLSGFAFVLCEKQPGLKPVLQKTTAPGEPGAVGKFRNRTGLVAGALLGHLRLRRAVPVSIGVADGHGSDGRSGLLDVGERADLHNFLRRLLQYEFFVNLADAGFFLEEIGAAPRTIFLGRGVRHFVVDGADACGVIGVNHERMIVGIEAHGSALGVDLMLAVFLIPLCDGGV